MDNFMNEYELVVQQLKAAFLDKIYREQGLVSLLTDKINEYDPEVQQYLRDLFAKQSLDVETTLALMDELAGSVLEIQNTGNLIRNVVEQGQIVEYVGEVPVEEGETVEYVEGVPVEEGETVEYVEEVPAEEGEIVEYVEEVPVEEVETVEYVEEVPVEEGETVEYVEEVPVEEGETVEYVEEVPVEEVETVEYVEEVPVEEGEIVEYVEEVPVEEGETVEYVEEVPAEEGEKTEYVEEVSTDGEGESGNDEEQSNGITFESYEQVDEAIQKFNKNTHTNPKAILVSGEQYSKLLSSRDTQKALFNSKNKIVNEEVKLNNTENASEGVNEVDNEITDVEATYTDKQKQIEELMNRANVLYQEGKLDEAQELYNKISDINSGLDASSN